MLKIVIKFGTARKRIYIRWWRKSIIRRWRIWGVFSLSHSLMFNAKCRSKLLLLLVPLELSLSLVPADVLLLCLVFEGDLPSMRTFMNSDCSSDIFYTILKLLVCNVLPIQIKMFVTEIWLPFNADHSAKGKELASKDKVLIYCKTAVIPRNLLREAQKRSTSQRFKTTRLVKSGKVFKKLWSKESLQVTKKETVRTTSFYLHIKYKAK